MDKHQRLLDALARLPAPERRAITLAILQLHGRDIVSNALALQVAEDVALAGARTRYRRDSDRRTDAARRVLVGARVPRERAEAYKSAASAEGLSLYAWVIHALDTAL